MSLRFKILFVPLSLQINHGRYEVFITVFIACLAVQCIGLQREAMLFEEELLQEY